MNLSAQLIRPPDPEADHNPARYRAGLSVLEAMREPASRRRDRGQDDVVPNPVDRRSGSPDTVAVRVRPGASRVRVGGRYDGPYGPALVVAVTAPPVDGRATRAVIEVVAKALGVRRAAVSVRAGGTGRDKLLGIDNPPVDLAERVAKLRDGDS